MKHTAGSGSTNYWTRNFAVGQSIGGLLAGTNNQLYSNSIGSNTTTSETYTYDSRGNMTGGINHLSSMTYNEANRLETVASNALTDFSLKMSPFVISGSL